MDNNIPKHIAVIPDGNRRWAKERGLPTLMGHKKGAENFDLLIDRAHQLGVKCFTTWIFSTENWKRAQEENDYLFKMARDYTNKYRKKCIENKIRFIHLGRKDRLPEDIIKTISEVEEETKSYTEFTIGIGFDYGGHDELLRTLGKLKDLNLEVTKENIEANLDTKDMPMPDVIIRTSGEQRLSGFMSWQCEYAELFFPKVYFPDFNPDLLEEVIRDYQNRERRFGGDSKKTIS